MDADVFAMVVFGEERSTKVGPEDISTFENNNLLVSDIVRFGPLPAQSALTAAFAQVASETCSHA